jgi:L-amino acid N-acyltransferase YncA
VRDVNNLSVIIRDAFPADAAAIAKIYRPVVEKTVISFELDAPDAAEMRSRMRRVTRGYPWLVAVDSGAVVGYAYGSPHRERAAYASSLDVSVYVDCAVRGRGVGSALYAALFRLLEQGGTFHRAFAGVALPNDASIALHKKHGFELVGIYREVGRKFGRWIDVAWWQRELRDDAGPGGARTSARLRC